MVSDDIKVALIGLDTSHAVEFPRFMQDPARAAVAGRLGMRATRCLSFETPFQGRDGLAARRRELESLGMLVTEDFDTAVADCDAIMIEINDPSLHREYFERCAELGKPVFLDKPWADTLEQAAAMRETARKCGLRWFTASPLRWDVALTAALESGVTPESAVVWGPLGSAPAGSSVIWYGVHSFEMLERIMGPGAVAVRFSGDRKGGVCHVVYGDGRRGTVELTAGSLRYGGVIRDDREREVMFQVGGGTPFYVMLLREVAAFFRGKGAGVPETESFEIMAMLAAAERSAATGSFEPVFKA